MSALAAKLVAVMLAFTPAARAKVEPLDEQLVRYEAIAEAIDSVATGPREAALLLAIAVHESGLRRDIDLAEVRGAAGECGAWQLMPPSKKTPCSMFGDRAAQAKRALDLARRSIGKCGHGEVMLAAYASGSCDRGLEESRSMVLLARRFFSRLEPVSTTGRKGLQ